MKKYRHPDQVPDPYDPDFLDWLDSAIPLRSFNSLNLPQRPSGHPEWILTRNGRVLPFGSFTRAHHNNDPADMVTATGWPAWYPLSESDTKIIVFGKVLRNQSNRTRCRKNELSKDEVPKEYMDNPGPNRGKSETGT